MVLLTSIIAALILPKYTVTNLNINDADAAYRLDPFHIAVSATGGVLETFNDAGKLIGIRSPHFKGDLLGFDSAKVAIVGHEYDEYASSVSIDGGVGINFKGTPCWRTVFDRGVFLQTNGVILVASNEKQIAVVDDVGWHDMYCLSQDAESLFVIRGDFQSAKLEIVRHLKTLRNFHHSKLTALRTPSRKNLHVILPSVSTLVSISERKLLSFCFLDGFSKAELKDAPTISVGPGNDTQEPDIGICEIDCETGVGRLLARLKDTTRYMEGPSFNTPMERRRDIAAFDSNGSFAVVFGGSAFLFHCSNGATVQ